MAAAKWSTKTAEIKAGTDAAGRFSASVPLYDGTTKAATLVFTITADRALRVELRNEPDTAGLSDFQAWERVA